MNFTNYLTSLAAEGETVLFVRQKPRKGGDGQLQYHADGAIKASWPAYLPERANTAEGAWYCNTGSFIIDRFTDGKPSAGAACCEYVVCLVLDDVGTDKAPRASPVPPTWVMETSEGCYQWGYAFSEQPTKGAYSAAIRAITQAGYGDTGAINPVRNFRLPGSVNLKPNKGGFRARLVEFHPEREYTLPALCSALGVEPGPDDTGGVRPIRLSDDGSDDVLAWLSAQGLVTERPNAEGWAGVVCPNASEHSDGSPEGRYLAANRAFCCYHSHCDSWDSARFLAWVAEQGGPKHTPGLRDELLAARMAEAMAKLTPTEAFPDAAAAVVAEVERREAGRVEREGWFERFAYLHADDGYFDLIERKQYSRGNFNAIYRHITCWSVHAGTNGKKRRVEASISYDENRQAMGARVLQGVTYAPGETVLVAKSGDVYANLWRDARPIVEGEADVRPWLDLVERLLPEASEREHLFDWMGYKVQHPEVKINHGVLLGGAPGIGKDTTFEPFLYAVGGPSRENVALIKNEELNSQWGYSLMSEVLVINELRQADASDRRALENRLKPLLAAPPELIPVNRKGLHPFDALNRLSVVAFSNERMAITLPSDDRRWFVLWSDARPLSKAEGAAIWGWFKAGGRAAVAGWLRARDVRAFAPGGAPPMTEAKAIMLSAGLSAVESALVEMMRERRGEFALGAIKAPWQALADRLQAQMPVGAKCSVYALFHALREAGWIDLGRVKATPNGSKVHVYAAPDVLESVGGNRAEIKRMLDSASGSVGLRAVK